MNPKSTDCEADALTTTPTMGKSASYLYTAKNIFLFVVPKKYL